MHHLQRIFLDSATSAAILALNLFEKVLLSYFRHKLEIKYSHLLKYTGVRNIFNRSLFPGSTHKSQRYKSNISKNSKPIGENWDHLIKVTASSSSASLSITHTSSCQTSDEIQIDHRTSCFNLSEKYVLFIGGRGKLYREYHCLIESLGGNLIIYRGNQKEDTARLPDLLTFTDMVICPVDCVHHETYFAVKSYCDRTNKPYVLLARSDLPTFRKGIYTLAGTSSYSTE